MSAAQGMILSGSLSRYINDEATTNQRQNPKSRVGIFCSEWI
ncbi:hypothetical protein VPBB_A0272 [Vibrio parahaemolyticus BB22OP]|nr:hypothetical protein VPBB_A0272 [Vibrio parahaemolyticus BB22OP]